MTFAAVPLACMLLLPAVDGLGDRRFAVRERCHKLLASAGPLAWPALAHGERTGDEETRRRCRLVSPERIRADADRRADTFLAQQERLPWLCFDGSGYDCGEAAWVPRREGGQSPEYEGWRDATAAWVRSLFRSGWQAAAVQRELDRMAAAERRYRAR